MKQQWAIFIDNDSNIVKLIKQLLKGDVPPKLAFLKDLHGALFSKISLDRFLDEEDRHETKIIAKNTSQALRTMSSGEQKKALLNHLLAAKPDFIILDNPFDNLDTASQKTLCKTLQKSAEQIIFIQLISRKNDLLPFIKQFAELKNESLSFHTRGDAFLAAVETSVSKWPIPKPLAPLVFDQELLIHFDNVSVQFDTKTVLQAIQWKIKKGEFWQLIGKNGSGKTTLLSMLTGENPKGYGQELYLFGKKKGSGESIWDIKKNIGYFTPSMTAKFTGYHTVEHMIISGLNDSIGLYLKPTEAQLRLAKEWLLLINLWDKKDTLFHRLSTGQQRLVMTTRAMIKHPLLLILDEPTAGLDDVSAQLLVHLVNKIALESTTTILFVSHRKEPGLTPDFTYELVPTDKGSIGKIT